MKTPRKTYASNQSRMANITPIIGRSSRDELSPSSSFYDDSIADQLGPDTQDQDDQIILSPTTNNSNKRLRSARHADMSPSFSENDIVVLEHEGHRFKVNLYNEFRCKRCKASDQICVVEVGRKGSHLVRCELCIARNLSLTHCNLPLDTLLDLEPRSLHLQYTINKVNAKRNGREVPRKSTKEIETFTSEPKSSNTGSHVGEIRKKEAEKIISNSSNTISDNSLREAKARLNSLRKACEINGDKFIASQLEDIISECLS